MKLAIALITLSLALTLVGCAADGSIAVDTPAERFNTSIQYLKLNATAHKPLLQAAEVSRLLDEAAAAYHAEPDDGG